MGGVVGEVSNCKDWTRVGRFGFVLPRGSWPHAELASAAL